MAYTIMKIERAIEHEHFSQQVLSALPFTKAKPLPEVLALAENFTVDGSGFADPGGDWTRYTLRGADGTVLWSHTIDGY